MKTSAAENKLKRKNYYEGQTIHQWAGSCQGLPFGDSAGNKGWVNEGLHVQGCREGVCVVTQPRARVRADASQITHQIMWPGLHCVPARGWSGGLPKQVAPLSRWTESQTRVKTTSRKKKKNHVKRPGSRVTNLSWFAWDFLGFKSESLTPQEPQAKQGGWSPYQDPSSHCVCHLLEDNNRGR